MKFENVTAVYEYFDDLVEQDVDADILFASSYIRGFISLAASKYGNESQPLTELLAQDISNMLVEARTELSPQDKLIVNDYWNNLKACFIS